MTYSSRMRLAFTKMHGLGNDFIVFDAPADAVISAAAIQRCADRRTGIGFDQALLLQPPRRADTDAYYRVFNADGSEVEQCGNGARCIGRLLAGRLARREVALDSPAGRIDAVLCDDGLVSVNLGVPNFDPAALPFDAAREADFYPLRVAASELRISAVSVGNPHAVIQVPSVHDAAVEQIGPAVEKHPRFPQRTNVGFMEVVSRSHIRLRVFERGVGETAACGTGACAAAATGQRLGLLDTQVAIDAPGGSMMVRWEGPGENIWLTGPAITVFEGTVEI